MRMNGLSVHKGAHGMPEQSNIQSKHLCFLFFKTVFRPKTILAPKIKNSKTADNNASQ